VTVVSHAEPSRHGKPMLQVPSGIYVFSRRALGFVPERGFYDIKETLIPQLHRAGERVLAYSADSPCPRALDAASYRAVNEWMVEHLVASRKVPEGYVLSGGCLVHRDAVVSRDATLVGPVMVGPGARIEAGAVVVGPSTIGRNAVIGRGVMVSRSAVWRRSVLHDQSVADRCILADDTIIASRTQSFRRIVVAPTRRPAENVRPSARPVPEAGPFELLRRMSRAVFGDDVLSRYPAAQ
jgi:mannose-1-phosphate guanylyltransferase